MYSNKQIIHISLPIFLGLLAQNIINVTDTAFLGHVSEVALGASAIGGLFYICIFTVAFGFSIGSQIVIARRNGEQQYHQIGPVMIQGSFFLLMLAVVMFGLIHLFGENIIRLMVSSDAVYSATIEFVNWRIYGFFFVFLGAMFRAFFIGITRTRVITLNAIVMALTNVVLDYALIFGKFGLPEMGIAGAAIASVIAEAASLAFYLIYTYCTVDFKKYCLNKFTGFDFSLLKRILNISSFTMLQHFLSMGTFFVFFMVVERLGERQLAIANIARSIYILFYIPVNALSTTTNSLVSNTIGAGNISFVMPLIKHIGKISFYIMLTIVVIAAIFIEPILSIYTNNAELIAETIPSIYVISVAMIIASVSNVVFSGISGTGNTRAALFLELGVLFVYIAYVFIMGRVFRFPVEVCFTTEIIYYTLMLTASYIYLVKAKWQNKKI